MAQQDNTLRAPAEGFGQEVTFSFSPDTRDMPTLDSSGAQAARGGVQGSPVAGGVQQTRNVAPLQEDPTMKLLSKAVSSFMAPRIKEARAEAFVGGMQRAAAGEAINDIANDQPWYTRIFGESDVIEGARVYTAQAKAAEAAGAIEDSMEEVRKLGPQAANEYYTKLVSRHMTGDDITDATIMQGFARVLPATMRRQAKEHYAWRQEEASAAESNAVMTNAKLLQKRGAAVTQNDDEYAGNAVQFFASMRPAEGRDLGSWQAARTKDLLNLAQGGQFHAVNVIRNSGLLDKLSPDQRTKIETALDTAESRTISTKMFEYAPAIAEVAADSEVFHGELNAEGQYARLAAINDRFRRETGIDRDLITLDKATGIVKDARVTIMREGERRIREAEQRAREAEKANDKVRADQLLKDGASQAVALGMAGDAARTLPDGTVHRAFEDSYRSLAPGGPQAQSQLLYANYVGSSYVNPAIKHTLETQTSVAAGAAMPGNFMALYEQYKSLRDMNPAAADAYFGKNADRMSYFHGMLQSGAAGDVPLAFGAAFGTENLPRPNSLDKKESKAARDSMTSLHSPRWWQITRESRMPLREDQADQAIASYQPTIERLRTAPGSNIDDATRRAHEYMKREYGADMLGGFYVRGTKGQQPLSAILKTHRKGIDSAAGTGDDANEHWDVKFKEFVHAKGVAHGADPKQPLVIERMPDVYGVAKLHIYYTGNDGRTVPVRVSSDDIKNFSISSTGRKVVGAVTKE